MNEFFRARVDGYDSHMLSDVGEGQYIQLGGFIPKTDGEIEILDIGCGTGLELGYIWKNAPNAHFTCLDLSKDMLALLVKKHSDRLDCIKTVEASYLDWAYPVGVFDIAVSSQTMHHFLPQQKIEVYRNLYRSLKSGGFYLENDWYVDDVTAEQYRRQFESAMSTLPAYVNAGEYHIDIPFTIEAQKELLAKAGFHTVEVLESHIRVYGSGGILKAGKQGAA